MTNKVWLIGAGLMSKSYVEVLQSINYSFIVIGNSLETNKKFEQETGINAESGGLEEFLKTKPSVPEFVINAVGIPYLVETTISLLDYGVKNILLEKPGSLTLEGLKQIRDLAQENSAQIFIAYNRRFYQSVLKCKELISKEGGIQSILFEFTEWSHKITPLNIHPEVKQNWFLANSTHVIDLAGFFGDGFQDIQGMTSGSLPWHPDASRFVGHGIMKNQAIFSYIADWESAGRWSVEILTDKNRYIFKPMEKLKVQQKGTIGSELVEIDYTLDENFKPGLKLQVETFLDKNHPLRNHLKSIDDQIIDFKLWINNILGK